MAAAHHLALFHPRLVRKRIESLDPALFRTHEKTMGVWLGSPRLSPSALAELRKLFETEAPPLLAKRARILDLEREIAAAVHAAYGLDVADLALLRETAPPRMPPGW